jgi:hypothetical protein
VDIALREGLIEVAGSLPTDPALGAFSRSF